MSFQSVLFRYVSPPTVAAIAPYYGLSTATLATPEMILGLPGRGTPGSLDLVFSLNAQPGQFQWWASPVAFGAVRFLDRDSQFYGGWDGANNDPQNVYGPRTITINGIPFYTYRTDYDGLDLCNWTSSFDPNP